MTALLRHARNAAALWLAAFLLGCALAQTLFPIMSTTSPTAFAGFARETLAAVVGPEASARVYEIEQAEMTFGEHWRWIHGRQVYTEGGLRLLATRFRELGLHDAAQALEQALTNALASETELVDVPAAELAAPPPERLGWAAKWEDEHQ